jgi:23S rRNA-/tRNA-specific pseudouridylate synthase
VSKEYLAITVGVPQQQAFSVDACIDRHPSVDTARRIDSNGKPALTEFEVGHPLSEDRLVQTMLLCITQTAHGAVHM